MDKLSKEKVLKVVKNKKFIAIAGVVVISVGVFVGVQIKAKLKQGDINYLSQLGVAGSTMTSTGTFKYTLDIQSGDKTDAKSASDEDAKQQIKDAEQGDSSSVEGKHELNNPWKNDGVFTDSWTGLDGVKKSDSKNVQYRVTYSGTVSSLDPLTAQGEVTLASSTTNNQKLKLLDFKVVEGVYYVNLPETKKSLQDSGNKDLIAIGNAMPDYGSVIKFEKSDFILDSIFGDSYEQSLSDINYTNERKEWLRVLSTATGNLQPVLKAIKPTVYSKDTDKYYFSIDKKNIEQVVGALDKFNNSSDKVFKSYLDRCVTDKVFDSDIREEKENGTDKVKELVDSGVSKLEDIIKSDNFESVNWIRTSGSGDNAKAEMSIQATWNEADRKYYVSLSGEHSKIIDKNLKIVAPKSSIEYSKTARNIGGLRFSKLVDNIKSALSSVSEEKKDDTKQVEKAVENK